MWGIIIIIIIGITTGELVGGPGLGLGSGCGSKHIRVWEVHGKRARTSCAGWILELGPPTADYLYVRTEHAVLRMTSNTCSFVDASLFFFFNF